MAITRGFITFLLVALYFPQCLKSSNGKEFGGVFVKLINVNCVMNYFKESVE